MLSNNMKLLCITILCALIGAVVIIAFKTDSGGEPAFSRPVYTVSDGEIDNIEVENESGGYCIERNEEKKVRADGKEIIDIVYGVKNRAGVTLSQDKVKELLNDFYEFHVIKTFSNIEEKDLIEYGFTGTDAYVTINKKDGASDTFILGGVTPDEKKRYVWKKGEDKVYTMLKVKESSFLNELNYYRERRIGTLDAYTLLSFSVTDKGERIMGIRYKNQNDREVVTTDAITYVMVMPYKEAVNIERFGELMSAFDEVRAVDFTEDNPRNLSKHGLDDAHALRVVIQDVEQNGMIKAPDRLKENIMSESKKINNQVVRQANNASAKLELWLYGLKTAVAVTVAIILFGFINQPSLRYEISDRYGISYEDKVKDYSNYGEKRTILRSAMDKMDEKLGQITDRFSDNNY